MNGWNVAYESLKSLTGVILAGGQSRRFGEDKARVTVQPGNQPLLVKLVSLLDSFALHPIVIADKEDKYDDLGISCVVDFIPNKGPLGGIYTALRMARSDKILVLTCDMPCVDTGLLKKMLTMNKTVDNEIVFVINGERQPFPGVYTQGEMFRIKNFLDSERLEVKNFLNNLPGLFLIHHHADNGKFFNMNTPEDYTKMLKGGFYEHAGTH